MRLYLLTPKSQGNFFYSTSEHVDTEICVNTLNIIKLSSVQLYLSYEVPIFLL